MSRLIIAAFFALVGMPASAQTPQTGELIVEGQASLDFAPDRFQVLYEVNGFADTRPEAIRQSETVVARIRELAPGLEGLMSLEVSTLTARLSPIRARECLQGSAPSERQACEIEAWSFERTIVVRGGPAEIAGPVIALAADLDVSEASLDRFYLSNPADARRAAETAALVDARRKAESLAEAAGANLGSLLRLQAGEGFRQYDLFQEEEVLRVTASRRTGPSVNLELEPQPVSVTANVVAAFRLDEAN